MVVNPYLTQELLRADILGLLFFFCLSLAWDPVSFYSEFWGREKQIELFHEGIKH